MHAESGVKVDANSGQPLRDIVVGTRLFQRFTLQKILSRSGMGAAWLARDDRLGQLVTLKLVPEAICNDAFARENLKRETRKSVLLTHPNIARIFDFVEDGRGAAVSMEFVDGETLSALRTQKRAKCFAVGEIAPWVNSLCDALAYGHDSAGLVHGDLKPSNLMVNSRMALKITDFGIAWTPRGSLSSASVGHSGESLQYMSPQLLLGESPKPTDDIYAVGATLYELLSSKPPFLGENVATQVREATAPWVAERREKLGIAGEAVPKHWEETIAACLAKNPADRPQTPVDLARRLRLGGAIRLVAAQQESKMRALIQALTQARIVGATAGVVALVAAGVIALRSSHSVSAVKQAVRSAVPEGFAMEVLRPDPAPPSVAPMTGALQLRTAPAGASFAVYPGVIAGAASPVSPPLREGTAPESIADLPPGRYTLFFHNEGWPDERAEISLEAGETLPVEYTFPHGSANITSTPDGAEIFLGTRSLGHTPLAVDLPLGKQQLAARHPERAERNQMVVIESGATATVAFELHAPTRSRGKGRPESAFEKFTRSLKEAFSRKPSSKR